MYLRKTDYYSKCNISKTSSRTENFHINKSVARKETDEIKPFYIDKSTLK